MFGYWAMPVNGRANKANYLVAYLLTYDCGIKQLTWVPWIVFRFTNRMVWTLSPLRSFSWDRTMSST